MTTARRIAVALEAAGLPVVQPCRGEILVLRKDVIVEIDDVMVRVDFHDWKRQAVHQEMWLSMGIDYVVGVIRDDCNLACSLFLC